MCYNLKFARKHLSNNENQINDGTSQKKGLNIIAKEIIEYIIDTYNIFNHLFRFINVSF